MIPNAWAVGVGIQKTVIALFIGAIIVDQYPCWISIPNCD